MSFKPTNKGASTYLPTETDRQRNNIELKRAYVKYRLCVESVFTHTPTIVIGRDEQYLFYSFHEKTK